ncbi:uncharacterized protein LOC123891364 [Trifolium pratense]|uniref:uncharacterized protein LOC123891364 n=1 Tax=Trifolium pratense TaxID=57577 RepID=UPI001E69628B|nr:uncharacterized protein LOC123891364 [Trifolium pratense]
MSCPYSITYGDGSTTAGSFVNDSLTFNQVNGNLHNNAAENSSVVFGCGAKQSGTLGSSSDEALDGIIGFGQSNSSVLSQLAASGKICVLYFTSSSSDGDEVGSYITAPNNLQIKTNEKQKHIFGINDILLLWKITAFFDNGVECREALDGIIDRCSALQNIRQAVLEYRKVFNQQHVEPRVRRVALNRGAEYLERYFRLIAFAAYLGSEAFDGFCGEGESKVSFKNWLHQRPEVQAMKWSIRLRPGRFFTVPEELRAPQESQHGDAVMEAFVKGRSGSVLGKGSILKMCSMNPRH